MRRIPFIAAVLCCLALAVLGLVNLHPSQPPSRRAEILLIATVSIDPNGCEGAGPSLLLPLAPG
jgi:hypothetical protein